jgi:pantothenate synthetase
MASERQVAANRANALKSTGPRTAAGRAKSSRNAYHHGLSVPMAPDLERVESLARTLVRETAGEDQLEAARALAATQLELKRIRAAKVAATPTGLDQMLDPQALTRLCAIGRYERLALSLRKAAKRRLDEIDWRRRVRPYRVRIKPLRKPESA